METLNGAVLFDLSATFDLVDQEVLVLKLEPYNDNKISQFQSLYIKVFFPHETFIDVAKQLN